jgi:hypothetical protein
MTDIVERLRHNSGWMQPNHHDLAHEAADAIERLREEGTVELAKALLEIERLRDLLAEKPKPDLRALLPELAVIRQVMKDTKP